MTDTNLVQKNDSYMTGTFNMLNRRKEDKKLSSEDFTVFQNFSI